MNKLSKLIVGIAVFAIIGTIFILATSAATPTASFEPENGTKTNDVSTMSDTTASSGSAVQFGSGVPMPPASVTLPVGKSWRLLFSEEFAGNFIDQSKWSKCWDWTYNNCDSTSTALDGVERYDWSQIKLNSGIGSLVAEPLNPARAGDCYQGLCKYMSGLINTDRPGYPNNEYRFAFTYGYVEGRIKVSKQQGAWNTFWMLPRSIDLTTDYTHEIDILELAGEQSNRPLQTYHYNNRTQQYSYDGWGGSTDYAADWHTFGVDWQPSYVRFYIDGNKTGEYTIAANIYNKPMVLILELMVNSWWNRNFGTPLTDYSKVISMDVDYVRVWQYN